MSLEITTQRPANAAERDTAMKIVATLAHEIGTPLASIALQANALGQMLPVWKDGYDRAVEAGLIPPPANAQRANWLAQTPKTISGLVDRANFVLKLTVSSGRTQSIDTSEFMPCSMSDCVRETVESYPFTPGEAEKVRIAVAEDFRFKGSRDLMVLVLSNLVKNALYALNAADKGEIEISVSRSGPEGVLRVKDTGSGIPAEVLTRIFEPYYTTKGGAGTGIGLPFCRRVLTAFQGTLVCDSREGEYTTFVAAVPAL